MLLKYSLTFPAHSNNKAKIIKKINKEKSKYDYLDPVFEDDWIIVQSQKVGKI